MLDEIADGRTDRVFDYLAAGHPAGSTDGDGVTLVQWCAYYGDVSAIRFLLANGASLDSLGDNLGLTAACFHGHWRLCQFLVERGADVNLPVPDTGETPLHSALATANRGGHNLVLRVLLAHGADPNCATRAGVETGCFMRDCRTMGETPLHRAAAFGDEEAIQLLLDAGAAIDARHGASCALGGSASVPTTEAGWKPICAASPTSTNRVGANPGGRRVTVE